MKIFPLIFLLLCMSGFAKTAKTKPHAKTSSTHHAATSRARSKSGKRRQGTTKAAAVHRPSYQQAPSSERYKEIQEALVAKGYLKSAPDGIWNADTADALKRFQADQNLSTTGKVNSLSLIALGLGPKPAAKP